MSLPSTRPRSALRASRCSSSEPGFVQYELLPNLLIETSHAGARGVHWVQRIDLNQVRFEDALLGKNTQFDRPFNYIASGEGSDSSSVTTATTQPISHRAALLEKVVLAGELHESPRHRFGRGRHQHLRQPGQHARHQQLQPAAGSMDSRRWRSRRNLPSAPTTNCPSAKGNS